MTFRNDSDQKERRAILKNDTFHTRASAEADLENQGRFAKASSVTASSSAVHYPRVLSGPWADQPGPGPEPPYGEDISSPPIVGEYAEVQASLDRDFGLQRSLQDGVPSATGPVMPRSSEPTPDAEATRVNLTKERTSLASSVGRHSITQRRVSPNNIKRRLV
jgi:hypothetical protein